MALTLPEFVARWQASSLNERSAAQSHFIDLCDVLGQPRPAAADQSGAFYTFDKGVSKTGGGQGFADVWLRGHFAVEYKGKRKNLSDAYTQLLAYREDLKNPPQLVVCDLNRFEVHTNFTSAAKRVYAFDLADLLQHEPTPTSALPPLDVLRALCAEPARLRPQETTAQVTERGARVRQARREPAASGHGSGGGGPLLDAAALLPVRRGYRPPTRPPLHPPG